ncbi:DEAD/DEAH box helicase [bacterium]|nr:DEAD/DEAH box helicase [bacterium]
MSFSSFTLDERLLRAVEAAGYAEPTPIQTAAIPPCLEGHDIIGTAQTGTGKTAAFVLPILQSLLTTPAPRGRTRALIVTPTRELAEQIHAAIKQLAKFTKIKSATVYGGVGFPAQEKALRQGTEIIVACPGRLLDHVQRGNAKLEHVEVLVLDEADRMLDMGFLPPVRRICQATERRRQTMLFSATFAPELNRLASEIMHRPERIGVAIAAPAQTVEHTLCPVPQERKTELLLHLLERTEARSVLIFTRTKHRADRVAAQIERNGHQAAVLHSNKSQGQRQRALDGFREGKFKTLVATDIAARGIDVAGISHVINYDMPDCADAYIHRIGRTGRAEHTGDALTLVTADDREAVRDIEKALGKPITVREIEGFDYGRPTFQAPAVGRNGRPASTPSSWSGGARTGGRLTPRRASRRR